MKSVGFLIALSLTAPLLTASAASAQGTITIPCSRVDEFVHGAIDVPAGAAVEVSAVTVSQLIARVGGPKNFAALMRTPEGRRAVKDAGAISDEEFAWCKQRVEQELARRQRAHVERPGPAAGAAVIPFTPGQPIHVEVGINDSARVRLILDTGADRTTITPRILRAAGLAPRRTTTILGVTGQADVDVYEIASLEVGGAKVGPLTVYGYDTAKLGSDGLLGRDFLDQFTVTIDNAVGLVTLAPKTRPAAVPPSPSSVPARATAGWYLLSPPYTDDGGVRSDALLTSWNAVGSFDTAAACEREREYRRQFALAMFDLPTSTDPTLDKTLRSDRQAKLRAQCIGASDPRLGQSPVAVLSQPNVQPPPRAAIAAPSNPPPPSSTGGSAPPSTRELTPLSPELTVQMRSLLTVRSVVERAQWHHDPPVGEAVLASDGAACKDETWRAFREAWRPFREGGGKDVAAAEALAPVVVLRATDQLLGCMKGRGYAPVRAAQQPTTGGAPLRE